MNEITLDLDEGIILEADDVTWFGTGQIRLDRLSLTNKNIYISYKEKNGLFSKATDQLIKRSLSDIKVINGQPMVDQVKNGDYGMCLQVQFMQGREIFAFDSKRKKKVANWIEALYKLLTGEAPPIQEKEKAFGGFSGLKSSLKNATEQALGTVSNAAGSAAGTVTQMAKQAASSASSSFETAKESFQADHIPQTISPQVAGQQNQVRFCVNCGNKLELGAQFCSGCGAPVGNTTTLPVPPSPQAPVENPVTRQQEFAGVVLKCPNCGAPIGQTTVVCPECGHHITGQAAVNSVQRFSDQLMLLESKRKRAGLGQMMGVSADPVDVQKLSLIRSFPIPNTIDDIQEFMLLAVASIDVSLSKKSALNKIYGAHTAETSTTIPRTISNAWVSKMQQAYQKAATAFPNEPAFAYIKQLYADKMKELKLKIEE